MGKTSVTSVMERVSRSEVAQGAFAAEGGRLSGEEAIDLRDLYDGYTDEVHRFIGEYPVVADLLREAGPIIARYFSAERTTGPSSHPRLDFLPKARTELLVLIPTPLEVGEAEGRYDRMLDEWWLDRMPIADRRMFIDLEYV